VTTDIGDPILGTSWYMSPEAVLGLSLDERSDVYSLGTMLFEMLSGQVPFALQDEEEAMRCQLWETPALLSTVCTSVTAGSELEGFVARCLAKGPDDRPGSMHEVLEFLRRVDSGSGTAASA
jgi:eukaryotic-like serine/threonine-protein kinase